MKPQTHSPVPLSSLGAPLAAHSARLSSSPTEASPRTTTGGCGASRGVCRGPLHVALNFLFPHLAGRHGRTTENLGR